MSQFSYLYIDGKAVDLAGFLTRLFHFELTGGGYEDRSKGLPKWFPFVE